MQRQLLIFLLLCQRACSVAAENVVVFSSDSKTETARGFDEELDDGRMAMVTVNLQRTLSTIGPYFVGVTIDSQQIRYNWSGLDFSSKRLQNMARALVPTYFRLGGTAADSVTYDFESSALNPRGVSQVKKGGQPCGPFLSPFNMTAQQIEAMSEFVKTVGWDFIMDLNAKKRNPDNSWDPENARQFLQFCAKRNYSIAGFELGNEYSSYPKANYVSPMQLAADYGTLQSLLAEFPDHYYSAFLVGPEVGTLSSYYFAGFLAAGGYNYVRGASFHQYYFNSGERILSHFTDVSVMDRLKHDVSDIMNQSRLVDPSLPVWLSETSTASNCGTANMSDRFVAGFLWLDKLGVSSAMGVQCVIRQDFYGFNYGLLGLDQNPNPDFWLTVLYKRIVQGAVFSTAVSRRDVRVYTACANRKNFKAGSLVVYLLNPNNFTVTFDMPQFKNQALLTYILTAGDQDGLVSKFVKLNGVKLEMDGDQLPNLSPKLLPHGPVTLGPYSFGFVVVPEADASICREQP